MHALEVIIYRNAFQAGREAAEANLAGDLTLGDRIVAASADSLAFADGYFATTDETCLCFVHPLTGKVSTRSRATGCPVHGNTPPDEARRGA